MILAKKYKKKVIATEINKTSINSASKNIEANSLSEYITIIQSRGEIVENLLPEGNYSTLLCFPPIYDNDQTKLWKKRGWKGVESEMIGGPSDGMDFTFKLIDEAPCEGAEGKKIAFVHPSSTSGVLIELEQE